MATSVNPQASKPCRNFIAGHCRFADSCRFRHDVSLASSVQATPSPSGLRPERRAQKNAAPIRAAQTIKADESKTQAHPTKTETQKASPKRGEIPCRAWKVGSCAKANKCWFKHDPEIQAAGRHRQEAAAAVRIKEETRERRAQQAREMRGLEEEREERQRELFAAVAKEEAGKTIQRVVLGSIVTFGAGMDVRAVVTGFESCTVRISNLPLDAGETEILGLFTQQGIDPNRLLVTSVRKTQDHKQEATIVTDAEYGNVLAVGLDAIEFRNERLAFEVGVCNVSGGMGVAACRDADVLTISWRAPSVRYVCACESMEAVHAKVRELNGRVFHGRRLRAEINTAPPGRVLRNFNPISVKISNLPTDVLPGDLSDFTGLSDLQLLRTKANFDLDYGLRLLRTVLERYRLVSFNHSVPEVNADGIATVRAQFSSHQDAQDAHDYLQNNKQPCLNDVTTWLRLPSPHLYTLTIPSLQYEAQRQLWVDLKASVKDRKACDMTIQEQQARGIVRVRVLGSVKPAVGALKVRVESLASGEKVEGWHPALAKSDSAFARSVFSDTGAYTRGDWQRRQLKLYGGAKAVEMARGMINEELARLASQERTVHLPRQSVGYFIRQGLAELQAILGEDGVKFDPALRVITITGGEEARHALDRVVEQSHIGFTHAAVDSQHSCPICFDDIIAPVRLGCEHVYCMACLRHYLLSALDRDSFPLKCMGDEGKCESHITLPTIQNFLHPTIFNRLLDIVFNAYITKHPQELAYCKTPDCCQIYRSASSTSPSALQCPSCFSSVCPSCHDEGHEGVSCDQFRLQKDPEAQERAAEEWIRQQGTRIKRCPSCKIFIEKTEGCNHMTCRCGAHICWICMRLFPNGDIYEHMNNTHGSIYADDNGAQARDPFRNVDYAEQEEALRQARIGALRANADVREDRGYAPVLGFRHANHVYGLGQERERLARVRAERERRIIIQRAADEEAIRRRREEVRRTEEGRGGWCLVM